jgi:single-stranded DNA-binding protein
VIDALIAGRLHGSAAERVAKNGSRYVAATLRVATRNDETVFVRLIAFRSSVIDPLLALAEGDSVAAAGELAVKVWTDREGKARPSLDLLAHAITTSYHVARKRKAAAGKDEPADPPTSAAAVPAGASRVGDFNDEIPF